MKYFLLVILLVNFLTGCATFSAHTKPLDKESSPALRNKEALDKESSPATTAPKPKRTLTPNEKLIAAALEQVGVTVTYDPAYKKLIYPNGDVPMNTGVCADVIVRAFRKVNLDLQKEVHEDMKTSFSKYPKKWGLKAPDANIDHRRVPNLMTWFDRQGKTIPLSNNPEDFLPGDVVAWDLGNGLTHIGLVSDIKQDKNYFIVHNIGAGTQSEDRLFDWKIIGHYRYFNAKANTENTATTTAELPANTIKIGYIKNNIYDGECGCAFQLPKDYRTNQRKVIFRSDLNTAALLNINGRDEKLQFVEESAHTNHPDKVGNTSWSQWKNDKYSVRTDMTIRALCPPKDESCESVHYDAILTVTQTHQKQSLKLKGTCGC